MQDALRHVGLQDSPSQIVRAAVDAGRAMLGCDAVFAAELVGDHYPMTHLEQLASPGWRNMRIRPLRGLGGQVLAHNAPRAVDDYLNDTSISADFHDVVAEERLHGVACAPIIACDGIPALLYSGVRRRGSPGDTAVDALREIAARASIGIHHVEARAREKELQALQERQALAMELHDSVAQLLFSIGVAAKRASDEHDPRALARIMREIEIAAADARRELRATLERLARGCRTGGVAFDALLQAELRLFQRTTGCRVHATRAGESRVLPDDVQRLIIDVAREGLRNAVKHASATRAVVHVAFSPGLVTACVQAAREGSGREGGTGLGLTLLGDRARALGGSLELRIGDDRVSLLKLELPVPDASPAAESGSSATERYPRRGESGL